MCIMYKRFKKGFTIVELVIVIAVIAILAAVLWVFFRSLFTKHKKGKIKSEETQE